MPRLKDTASILYRLFPRPLLVASDLEDKVISPHSRKEQSGFFSA
jgi:hypothetical protein